jgi:hypothetical protein
MFIYVGNLTFISATTIANAIPFGKKRFGLNLRGECSDLRRETWRKKQMFICDEKQTLFPAQVKWRPARIGSQGFRSI